MKNVIISGPRQSGKTRLLGEYVRKALLEKLPNEKILFLSDKRDRANFFLGNLKRQLEMKLDDVVISIPERGIIENRRGKRYVVSHYIWDEMAFTAPEDMDWVSFYNSDAKKYVASTPRGGSFFNYIWNNAAEMEFNKIRLDSRMPIASKIEFFQYYNIGSNERFREEIEGKVY